MSRRSITIETSAYQYSEHEEYDQINQYRLQQEIGSGEFGKVRRCVSDIGDDNRTDGLCCTFGGGGGAGIAVLKVAVVAEIVGRCLRTNWQFDGARWDDARQGKGSPSLCGCIPLPIGGGN